RDVPVDFLTFSAHKFHGPKGAGGLFVRNGRLLTPLLHGGEQMGGNRAGTVNVAFMVGMGLAMELAVEALDFEESRVRCMRDRLEDAIASLPDTLVLGKREHRTPNTILASFKGIEGEAFIWDLDRRGVAASTGSACSSESLEADATLQAMVSDADLAHTAVRFSLSRFTAEEEIDTAIAAVKETVERLRSISSTY
ncbi:MAG: aminotransferase class V-fold PLP-dependent enzyme, partial [Spirochaetaceae bacterium]|nr:aminotransferase class V-fold PLP-dependent enzyme [Spirochaetaceae bacterium]